jgi:hypothetical protein
MKMVSMRVSFRNKQYEISFPIRNKDRKSQALDILAQRLLGRSNPVGVRHEDNGGAYYPTAMAKRLPLAPIIIEIGGTPDRQIRLASLESPEKKPRRGEG